MFWISDPTASDAAAAVNGIICYSMKKMGGLSRPSYDIIKPPYTERMLVRFFTNWEESEGMTPSASSA